MRSFIRWISAAALPAAVLLACGPTQVEPPPDAGSDAGAAVTVIDLCQRIARAQCGLVARCFASYNRDVEEQCRSVEETRCFEVHDFLRPSFDDKPPRVEIDEAKLQSCEERMANSACPPSFPPNYPIGIARPFSDCTLTTGLLRGTLPAESKCDQPVDCAPGTVCVKPGGVCTGTCSTALAAEGEPCGVGCAPGLFCAINDPDSPVDDRCEPLRAQNEPCESSLECHAELWCNETCRPRGAVGDPCRWDPDRLTTCASGLACDVVPWMDMEGVCVLPQKVGGPCLFHWTCQPGLVCYDLDLTGFPNTPPPNPGSCQAPVPLGEVCAYTPYAVFLGDSCAPGATCAPNLRCLDRPELGQQCNELTRACEGYAVYCKPAATGGGAGTCAGAPSLDERCTSQLPDGTVLPPLPCDTGYCDTENTFKCRPPFKAVGQTCGSSGECLSDRCVVREDRVMRCAASCG